MEGIARLIWLGDFLPPQLRISMDKLDEIEALMLKSQQELEQIEISVERIRLESVDDDRTMTYSDAAAGTAASSEETTDIQISVFRQKPELRTQIGVYSYKLDTLAASIDSVKSHSDDEVKRRKKQISNGIVKLMNDLDTIIVSFNLKL